jgi:hypothetical protein
MAMRQAEPGSRTVSDVKGEQSGQREAHNEHRPVREIQTEKSAFVPDTHFHDTLKSPLFKP